MDMYVAWAFTLGVMCSVSLVIGALLGIYFKMSNRIVGLMAAFGAGALLSALAIELVAPSIDAFMHASSADIRAHEVRNFFHLVAGAGVGGIIFVLLDWVLIEHGGYLRKTAYLISKVMHERAHLPQHTVQPTLVHMNQSLPTGEELEKKHASHDNAAVAIWLGNLLDGLPESFVVGTVLMATVTASVQAGTPIVFWDVLPYTLLAGLFLSNLPEALSSSAQMRMQGMSVQRILIMWLSLVLMTGIAAALGAVMGEWVPHNAMVFIEGLAAGAMLTMICAAMLPEATHLAPPNWVGLATLSGFFSALLFKVLE
jgi:zinc transporter, ZIP family